MAVPEYIQEQVLNEATSATPNYSIDPNDPRLTTVTDRTDEMALETEQMYDNMIDGSDQFYDKQIEAVNTWGDRQAQLQQERTDFIIEQQEQLKEQEHKDYLREQSGAYVDWRKQSNKYGAEAEKMASAGLDRTGYSESSQVSMYNTYQNRVATARESYKRAVLNYDNAIKDAQLQNNAALAEIAYNTLQKTLELSLAGFQYKNDLVLAKSDRLFEIEQFGHTRYMDMLGQINTENALKESIRQFGERMKFDAKENQIQREWQSGENEKDRSWKSSEAQLDRDFEVKMEGIKHEYKIKYLNAETKAEKERIKAEYDEKVRLANQELANNKALLKYENSLSSGGSVGSKAAITGAKTAKTAISNSKKITGNNSKNTVNTKAAVQGAKQALPATVSSYKEAVALMKKMGVPSSRASAAMTESEWSRRKNANSSAAEIKNYKSYTAYIRDYVSYCIEEYSK